MKDSFEKYVKNHNPKSSGTLSGYPRDLDMLEIILVRNAPEKLRHVSIWSETNPKVIGELYDYVLKQQQLGKKGEGIFVGQESEWRWNRKFYSAALAKYKDFLNEWESRRELEPDASLLPAFPEHSPKDISRRRRKSKAGFANFPEKTYEKRMRSIRISSPEQDPKTYLKALATNDDDIMVCQMCCKEMPFKLRNGKYYFEAVEIDDSFPTEAHQLYLALCSICAAKYKQLVKKHKGTLKEFIAILRESENVNEFVLEMHDDNLEPLILRFTDTHLLDIQTILSQVEE